MASKKNQPETNRNRRGLSNTATVAICVGVAVATLGGVLLITSLPDADERFRDEYCYYANEDKIKSGEEQSKVWICPAPLK